MHTKKRGRFALPEAHRKGFRSSAMFRRCRRPWQRPPFDFRRQRRRRMWLLPLRRRGSTSLAPDLRWNGPNHTPPPSNLSWRKLVFEDGGGTGIGGQRNDPSPPLEMGKNPRSVNFGWLFDPFRVRFSRSHRRTVCCSC
jgi:hypothetical protein